VDRADYEIVVSATDTAGWRQVELWMLPHKTYTAAKSRQCVYSIAIAGGVWTATRVKDFVLDNVFGTGRKP
jgi:hypothetical protein